MRLEHPMLQTLHRKTLLPSARLQKVWYLFEKHCFYDIDVFANTFSRWLASDGNIRKRETTNTDPKDLNL